MEVSFICDSHPHFKHLEILQTHLLCLLASKYHRQEAYRYRRKLGKAKVAY